MSDPRKKNPVFGVGVFIVVLLATRYVSLSSITAGFTYLIGVTFVFPVYIKSIIIYGMCICALILVTHQKNIERLLKGKESRVNLFKKKTPAAGNQTVDPAS